LTNNQCKECSIDINSKYGNYCKMCKDYMKDEKEEIINKMAADLRVDVGFWKKFGEQDEDYLEDHFKNKLTELWELAKGER
jgi:hypothetical protein